MAESVSLRVMVITHPNPACGRSLMEVVSECLDAGANAIQLRDKSVSDTDLLELARRLVEMTRSRGAC